MWAPRICKLFPTTKFQGGTAIDVNEKFNVIERKDMNIQNDDYQSIWVEIKYIVSKKYNYWFCLTKLAKGNKEVHICGDFNVELKIDNNLNYQQFYNMLCSYGFLPQIIQPTRVTDHHYLNIFSNNLIDETSGDILLTVCEHFSQVVSIKREKMD